MEQKLPSDAEIIEMLEHLKSRHKWQMIYAISLTVLQFMVTFAAGVVVGKNF
jgi:hypothetical protein